MQPAADAALPHRVERLQGRRHVAHLVAMFCRAFATDPHFNWLVRQDDRRASALAALFDLLLNDLAAGHGQVLATADLKAAMIVYPPGAWKLDWLAQGRFLRHYLGIAGLGRIMTRGLGLNLMEGLHPRQAHYFLQVLGVDPDCQGSGHGRALLAALIAESQAARLPIYLETGNPDNLAFYARFAFRVRSENRLPGGLRLWTLLREPGAGTPATT